MAAFIEQAAGNLSYSLSALLAPFLATRACTCAEPCYAVLGERFGNTTCLQALKKSLAEQTALAEEAASRR